MRNSSASTRGAAHTCTLAICDDCFRDQIRATVQSGALRTGDWGVRCPSRTGCTAVDSYATVAQVVGRNARLDQLAIDAYCASALDVRICNSCKTNTGWIDHPDCDYRCDTCFRDGDGPTVATTFKASAQTWLMLALHPGIRRCPGCSVYIEKNLGCPHMTCKHCGHQWCWKCKAQWCSNHKCWTEHLARGLLNFTVKPVILVGAVVVTGAFVALPLAFAPPGAAAVVTRGQTIFGFWKTMLQRFCRRL